MAEVVEPSVWTQCLRYEWCQRELLWRPVLRYFYNSFLCDWRKQWNHSISIAGLGPESWTLDLPNAKHKYQPLNSKFRFSWCVVVVVIIVVVVVVVVVIIIIIIIIIIISRDSSVGIATDYGTDDQMIGVRFPAGAEDFSLQTPRPDRLWGPPSLLSNGYRALFPRRG
jgi:hypothetical protein